MIRIIRAFVNFLKTFEKFWIDKSLYLIRVSVFFINQVSLDYRRLIFGLQNLRPVYFKLTFCANIHENTINID